MKTIRIAKPEAYQLLHKGVLALAQIEKNGIRIDENFLNSSIVEVREKVQQIEKEMTQDSIYKTWKKHYGDKLNLGSREQLGQVIFGVLGHPCKAKTATGRFQTDEPCFAHIHENFIKQYFQKERLKKVANTFLKNIRDEVIHGFLHPSFDLHTTVSYRSSSSNPNFQNLPVRNSDLSHYIRKCFIPRKGRQLVEIDYSGIEVRISACYHKDPAMLKYIKDPSKDMHRDMAMDCYLLSKEEVDKKTRYCAKNMFVFPQFYGSYYVDCARNLWEALDSMKLEVKGKSLKQHLIEKGIKKRGSCNPEIPPRSGTFEQHIKEVETDFWSNRFPVYGQWKKDWFRKYQEKGGFDTLTGFWIEGDMPRNKVINLPVQGSAFHCLLWSLTQIQRELKKRKMKTVLVGQIHDSLIADVVPSELDDYVALAREVMTKRLLRHWKWIIVPLDIEVEVTPVNGSWFEKKSYELN